MTHYVDGQPVTIDTLEWALDRMAVIMAEAPDGGITYLPIWHRLEAEPRCSRKPMPWPPSVRD